jgi:hypothetical protein
MREETDMYEFEFINIFVLRHADRGHLSAITRTKKKEQFFFSYLK